MTDKKNIINIISNKNKHSKKTSNLLKEKLSRAGFKPSFKYLNDAILNICVGGDGAFLRAVRANNFPEIPFIGINTGHLGFFQEIQPENLNIFIKKYLNNDYSLEDIYLVQAVVKTKRRDYTLTGVNEITIKTMDSRVIHLDVFIDDNHLQKFSGDGLIVSTPVGSTAYNMSSGGSIIHPTLKALQLTPLSPINSQAYRSLINSSVIPGNIPIKLEPTSRYRSSTLIVVDGEEYRFRSINEIILNISNRKIQRIVLDKNNYWNNLKSKFL